MEFLIDILQKCHPCEKEKNSTTVLPDCLASDDGICDAYEKDTWNDSLKKGSGVFYCGKCGFHADIALMDSDEFYEPKVCPECGRKVN